MTKTRAEIAAKNLFEAATVALVCHVNPDGDTVGAALALKAVLEKLSKTAEVFCDDFPYEKLSILQNFEKINTSSEKKFDLAVAVDFSETSRGGVSAKYFKHAKKTLAVDHHKGLQSNFGCALADSSAAATCELVYFVIRELEKLSGKPLMDDEVAKCLFVGLVTDTGCFRFSSVTARTVEVVCELYKFSFDAAGIIFKMLSETSRSVFMLKSRVLAKTKFFFDDRVAVITFRKDDFSETGTSPENTEGVVQELIAIKGVDVAVSICEAGEKSFKISVRSSEKVDAADMLSFFGGGGHKRAAGARLSGYYEDVLDKILKACGDVL